MKALEFTFSLLILNSILIVLLFIIVGCQSVLIKRTSSALLGVSTSLKELTKQVLRIVSKR